MRVIAGQAKGRHLHAPKGMSTRPTADRVKEAIFSVIAAYLDQSIVLDAFAGTGALGLEALSRGAKEAILIERNKKTFEVLKANIDLTGLEGAYVYCADCLTLLNHLPNTKHLQPFDLIFLDPPYGKGWIKKAVALILQKNILEREGILIIETSQKDKGQDIKDLFGLGLLVVKQSDYGDTAVLYCKQPDFADGPTNSLLKDMR